MLQSIYKHTSQLCSVLCVTYVTKTDKFTVHLCSVLCIMLLLFVYGATAPSGAMAPSFTRFLDHTKRRTTVGRTPLDEWSARRGDLYLTTHNIHNRQISMTQVGFEPTIPAGERPQTYALDHAATHVMYYIFYKYISLQPSYVVLHMLTNNVQT